MACSGGLQESVEVPEEHTKPVPARSSGSKRSRAAEVHNMSEKVFFLTLSSSSICSIGFVVHSLSDLWFCGAIFWKQRRRSRINEKMRALQNLIPNSNKVPPNKSLLALLNFLAHCVLFLSSLLWTCCAFDQTDKASMLDEAIEYLKQLQLQVQVSKCCQVLLSVNVR